MPVIKLGKLRIGGTPAPHKPKNDASALKQREIWDDFGQKKKVRKKVEYERSDKNRLVPKTQLRLHGTPKEAAQPVEEGYDDSRYRSDFEQIETKLNYTFKDRLHLHRALTHRSALGGKERTDYE